MLGAMTSEGDAHRYTASYGHSAHNCTSQICFHKSQLHLLNLQIVFNSTLFTSCISPIL